ncbi:hypothetical protein HNR39_002489 [Glaciimonas immobilis]|uniref:Uncharacterized protein n=1 Tax=Glaciimonas immobilis TaxID=728004 RepID=A0A840RQG7_9BURK|nr:hypothetical protein [Glaciimonas immobilis]
MFCSLALMVRKTTLFDVASGHAYQTNAVSTPNAEHRLYNKSIKRGNIAGGNNVDIPARGELHEGVFRRSCERTRR